MKRILTALSILMVVMLCHTSYAADEWDNSSGGPASGASIQVDIGGQTGSASGSTGQTSPEWINFTVDVSSLSDGSVYDLQVYLKQVGNPLFYAFLGSIIGFGS